MVKGSKIKEGIKDFFIYTKENRYTRTAVKGGLYLVPGIGPVLADLFDTATNNDSTKITQIQNFLNSSKKDSDKKLEQIAKAFLENNEVLIQNSHDLDFLFSGITQLGKKLEKIEIEGRRDTVQIRLDITKTRFELIEIKEEIFDKIDQSTNKIIKEFQSTKSQERQSKSFATLKPNNFLGEKQKSFVGRYSEIINIVEHFYKSQHPLTLWGMGGIGKSALAYAAIRKCEYMFDAIIPIYLQEQSSQYSNTNTLKSIIHHIRNTIPNILDTEFDPLSDEDKKEFILDKLKQFGKVLILTDNFEAVSDKIERKENEEIIKFFNLLPDNTKLIITSRRLDNSIDNETPVLIDGLNPKNSKKLFKKYLNKEISLSSKNDIIIEKFLESIMFHPLATEIVAKNYSGSGTKELEKLIENIQIIQNKVPKEKRLLTVEICLRYSVKKLHPKLRKIFYKFVMIFFSPFSKDRASVIFGVEEKIIYSFFRKSLLRKFETDSYGNKFSEENQLFWFHPLMQNYLEKTIKEKKIKVMKSEEKRFCEQYVEIIEKTYDSIKKNEKSELLSQFRMIMEDENNDIEKALSLLPSYQKETDHPIILRKTGFILQKLGNLEKSVEYLELSLKIYEKQKRLDWTSRICRNIAIIYTAMGRYEQALIFRFKALKIDDKLKSKKSTDTNELLVAKDHREIGITYRIMGKLESALEYFNKSLEIDQKLNEEQTGDDHLNIGNTLRDLGKIQKALEHQFKALQIHQKFKDKTKISNCFIGIGNTQQLAGNFEDAITYQNKALRLDEMQHNMIGVSRDHTNIGLTYQAIGDYETALEHQHKALKLHEEFEDKIGAAADHTNIGLTYQAIGDYETALEHQHKALQIHQKVKAKVVTARDYTNIANTLKNIGKLDESINYHDNAKKIDLELGDDIGLAAFHANMGNIWRDKESHANSIQCLQSALKIHTDKIKEDELTMAKIHTNLGISLEMQDNLTDALHHYETARILDKKMNDVNNLAKDYANIGNIKKKMNDLKNALELHNKALKIHQDFNSLKDIVKDYANIIDILLKLGEKGEATSLNEKLNMSLKKLKHSNKNKLNPNDKNETFFEKPLNRTIFIVNSGKISLELEDEKT